MVVTENSNFATYDATFRAQLGDRQVALPLRAVSRIRAQLAHRRQLGMLACLIQLALDG